MDEMFEALIYLLHKREIINGTEYAQIKLAMCPGTSFVIIANVIKKIANDPTE